MGKHSVLDPILVVRDIGSKGRGVYEARQIGKIVDEGKEIAHIVGDLTLVRVQLLQSVFVHLADTCNVRSNIYVHA